MALDKGTTIIIKKIKKGRHGHHGGAWKVAYADFVTAMMAFFLLMWLINVSTDEQKQGIADYFMPTFGVKGEVGNEREGGISAVKKGDLEQEKSPPGIIVGQVPQGPISAKPDQQAIEEDVTDSQVFQKAQEQVNKTFEEDPNFRDFKDNIIVEQNPEGLKIQLVDSDKHPMFEAGGSQLSQFGEMLLTKMSEVVMSLPNRISITGHTDATNYAREDGYSNWELSSERANSARRYMLTTKMESGRVYKVVGMADQDLLEKEKPDSPRNRRISIILLRGSYLKLKEENQTAPRGLLTVPKPTDIVKPPVLPVQKIKPSPAPRTPIVVPTSPNLQDPINNKPNAVQIPVQSRTIPNTTGISAIPGSTIVPEAPPAQ